jgi:parallel beta-helix repeat protein
MATRHRFRALSFTVALALAGVVALLWLLDGPPAPVAAAPACRPLRAPGDVFTVCLSGCDYTTIQNAVDAATGGEIIKVATGVYTGVQTRTAPAGSTVVTQVVYISKTVTIRGGYTTTNWTTPYPITQPTTLDAQEQGRVLYISGDISPTIEGLRITGGDAGSDPGGGVYVISATVTIRDNRVFSNTADGNGGGLFLRYSDATISGNTVISNTAGENGGGLYLRDSDATISGNTFTSNTVQINDGGGLNLRDSDATISGNTISANTAPDGGGLTLVNSAAELSGNTIISNTAHDDAGGLFLVSSAATLIGNTIISNTANSGDSCGGGLRLNQSDATLINNVVADNQAMTWGSGICVEGCSPRLLHTTIARNSGGDGRGVYVTNEGSNYSTVALTNTIIVSHTVGIYVSSNNTATLESTLWHGNTTDWGGGGAGTINHSNDYAGDPRFDADGYHLMAGSAAINRGVNAGVTTDIDGDSRDSMPDLGADELAGIGMDVYLPIIMKNASP